MSRLERSKSAFVLSASALAWATAAFLLSTSAWNGRGSILNSKSPSWTTAPSWKGAFDKSADPCVNGDRFGRREISAVLIPADHISLKRLADCYHRQRRRLRRNHSFAARKECHYQCNECRCQPKLAQLNVIHPTTCDHL